MEWTSEIQLSLTTTSAMSQGGGGGLGKSLDPPLPSGFLGVNWAGLLCTRWDKTQGEARGMPACGQSATNESWLRRWASVSARSRPLFQRLGPPEESFRDQGREGLTAAPRPHRTEAEEAGQLPGLPLSGRRHWAARGALRRFPRLGKGVPARPGWREAAISHSQGQALNKAWGLFLLSRAQSSQEETEAWLGP